MDEINTNSALTLIRSDSVALVLTRDDYRMQLLVEEALIRKLQSGEWQETIFGTFVNYDVNPTKNSKIRDLLSSQSHVQIK